ncbi:flagellar motor switch protein FliM [Izhakiella capsodis]|uniref:Flagellar motor switch protein FliM n=2 Tax=Izhakiella capsodis TaxID=1367852 RepID=A0A1I4YD63_9GAMM|nr:flagellar motor switch protein FliM [Izhakiella capsodis]
MMRLEVNKLGRPYHKVPRIFNERFDQLDGQLSIYFLRKFRVNTGLKEIQFQMDSWVKKSKIFSSEVGNLAFCIDRPLLLSALHDYYGLSQEPQPENINPLDIPVSKTEERLLNKMALEITTLLCDSGVFPRPLTIKPDHNALITQWSYRIDFFVNDYGSGGFSLLLDGHHVDLLLSSLREPKPQRNTSENCAALVSASFTSLPVRLHARLAAVTRTVAELAEFKPGDLLPILLAERVPLYVGAKPLLTAAICEENGKLYLSDFSELIKE